jgi:hypothetical protein
LLKKEKTELILVFLLEQSGITYYCSMRECPTRYFIIKFKSFNEIIFIRNTDSIIFIKDIFARNIHLKFHKNFRFVLFINIIQEKENCNFQVADELINFLFLDAQNHRKPHTKVWGGFWSLSGLEIV